MDGGRWNEAGVKAVYLADSETTALAEKGYYAILRKAIGLNERLHDHKHVTLEERSLLIARNYMVSSVTVDIAPSLLADISTPELLGQWCGRTKFSISFSECIHDVMLAVSPKTQAFARHLREAGASGIRAQSARQDGKCIVLFPDAFSSGIPGNIGPRYDVSFSAVHARTMKPYAPQAEGPVGEHHVHVERFDFGGEITNQQLIEVHRHR